MPADGIWDLTRRLNVNVKLSKFFYSPTDAQMNCLKNDFKIYIEIGIKTAPTCFGVITIIRESTSDQCNILHTLTRAH
jgi:hypothetical protein